MPLERILRNRRCHEIVFFLCARGINNSPSGFAEICIHDCAEQALVDDLRQRDKKIQGLELEREALAVQCAIFMSTVNATAAAKTGATIANSVDGSSERPDLSQERNGTGAPAGEQKVTETRELCDTPSAVSTPHEKNDGVRDGEDVWLANAEGDHPVKGLEAGKRKASQGEGAKAPADQGRESSVDKKRGAGTTHLRQKSDKASETQHRGHRKEPRSTSAVLPTGDGSRLQRKQLAPPTTAGRRRVSTISYPQHGSRVTLITPASDGSPLEDEVEVAKAEEAPVSTGSGSAERAPDEPPGIEDAEVSATQPTKVPCPAPPMPRRPSNTSVAGHAPTPLLPCHPSAEAVVGAGKPGGDAVSLSSSGERVGSSSDCRVAGKSSASTGPAAETDGEKGEDVCENDLLEGPAGPLATIRSVDAIAGNERPQQGEGNVDMSTPTPTTRKDDGVQGVVPTHLVDGVRVLKHSGRGKPKMKVLWVTPDLSEIFYTKIGR